MLPGSSLPFHPFLQIVSVIQYNNERDLLYARFLEHQDVVDIFVVIESAVTFSGRRKPLHFKEELCRRFGPFSSRVVHVVLNTDQAGMGSWGREHASRVRYVISLSFYLPCQRHASMPC